jgi:hypothetical protein
MASVHRLWQQGTQQQQVQLAKSPVQQQTSSDLRPGLRETLVRAASLQCGHTRYTGAVRMCAKSGPDTRPWSLAGISFGSSRVESNSPSELCSQIKVFETLFWLEGGEHAVAVQFNAAALDESLHAKCMNAPAEQGPECKG